MPSDPVTVSRNVPEGVRPIVRTVRTELPGATRDCGAKVPTAPLGSPVTARSTILAYPSRAVTSTVKVAEFPCVTAAEGVIQRSKSGCGIATGWFRAVKLALTTCSPPPTRATAAVIV